MRNPGNHFQVVKLIHTYTFTYIYSAVFDVIFDNPFLFCLGAKFFFCNVGYHSTEIHTKMDEYFLNQCWYFWQNVDMFRWRLRSTTCRSSRHLCACPASTSPPTSISRQRSSPSSLSIRKDSETVFSGKYSLFSQNCNFSALWIFC